MQAIGLHPRRPGPHRLRIAQLGPRLGLVEVGAAHRVPAQPAGRPPPGEQRPACVSSSPSSRSSSALAPRAPAQAMEPCPPRRARSTRRPARPVRRTPRQPCRPAGPWSSSSSRTTPPSSAAGWCSWPSAAGARASSCCGSRRRPHSCPPPAARSSSSGPTRPGTPWASSGRRWSAHRSPRTPCRPAGQHRRAPDGADGRLGGAGRGRQRPATLGLS